MTPSTPDHDARVPGGPLAPDPRLAGLPLAEAGEGRPVLVLHGGGGPGTVAGLAAHLARSAHTLTPTHPGWDGTPLPPWCRSPADLADAYLALLRARGLRDVLLVGSSLGGWIAAEMAVRDTDAYGPAYGTSYAPAPESAYGAAYGHADEKADEKTYGDDRRGRAGAGTTPGGGPARHPYRPLIGGLVLVGAVGIRVDGEPIPDFAALGPRAAAEHSFHDPDRFAAQPRSPYQEGNMTAMHVLAGDPYMHDPGLAPRLRRIAVPALGLWGESDRIVTPAYGARYAAAIGAGAALRVLPRAGHLPHLEQPEATFAALDAFLDALPASLPASLPAPAPTGGPAPAQVAAQAPAQAGRRADDDLN